METEIAQIEPTKEELSTTIKIDWDRIIPADSEEERSHWQSIFELPLTEEKAEALILLIYRYEALADAADGARAKAAADKADFSERGKQIRAYLKGTMEMSKQLKIKTPIGTASVTKAKEKLSVDENIADLVMSWPFEAMQIATRQTVEVKAKEFKELPEDVRKKCVGARFVLGSTSLTIR